MNFLESERKKHNLRYNKINGQVIVQNWFVDRIPQSQTTGFFDHGPTKGRMGKMCTSYIQNKFLLMTDTS